MITMIVLTLVRPSFEWVIN